MHLAGHKYKYDVIEARKKTTERSKEDKNSKIELKMSSVHLVNIFYHFVPVFKRELIGFGEKKGT